jgi:hypothetical protein
MKKGTITDIQHIGNAVLLGILVSVGMHIADWAIPDPAIQVNYTTEYLVCYEGQECEFLDRTANIIEINEVGIE